MCFYHIFVLRALTLQKQNKQTMSAYSLQDRILLCLTMTAAAFCLSSAEQKQERECYGSSYQLPFEYSPRLFFGQLFFTPTNGGEKKLVIQNQKLQDPRFTDKSVLGLRMPDLTEQDDGVFSVMFNDGGAPFDVIKLVVEDCDDVETKEYGGLFSVRVPEGAAFLEFTPVQNLPLVTVVWNRTNPKGSRGSVNRNYWEITGITQEQSGYYKFRGKDNKLLDWRRLEVEAYKIHHVRDEGTDIYIKYPDESNMWTVIFSRGATQYTLEKEGYIEMPGPFGGRIDSRGDAIVIYPLQYEDSGIFEFRDVRGNLAQRVVLEVKTSIPPALYYAVIVGSLFLLFGIYCCVKKCCCKKNSSKRNNPAPQPEAAPDTTQSTISPAPVHSYQPTSTTDAPPAHDQVNVNVNPPHPEVAVPGWQGATPLLSNSSNFISDSDPKFEMKGMTFPSALPLSSDTTFSDVYNSDKLNVL